MQFLECEIILCLADEHHQFLESLGSLLASASSSGFGSIFLTQKSLFSEGSSEPSQILIRATNGASSTKSKTKPDLKVAKEKQHNKKPKIKLATVVEIADLDNFYNNYADVCKKGMEGMRKRDKKKAKEKAKAAKKKKGNTAT
jgi:signal recognition particle subunit SRP14